MMAEGKIISGVKMQSGWKRLGIVLVALLIIGLLIPSLKIHHFSPFNSGVSTIIGLVALLWLVYWIISWVSRGFKN